MTAATYSVRESLRDGRPIQIRALRPDDETEVLEAVDRTNPESLRRRFFVTKRGFSQQEKSFFMHPDFVNHVALVGEIDEAGGPAIVGGGRYIVTQPGEAEVAFVVIDAYQGQGIGRLLMKHLIALAKEKGLRALTADVLPENAAMLRLFKDFGFRTVPQRDFSTVHLVSELR